MERLRSLFLNRSLSVKRAEGFCCLYLTEQQTCLAYVHDKNTQAELKFLDVVTNKKNLSFAATLETLVKKHQIEGVPCSWILQPDKYQLFLMDELPVPAAEFQAAVRWKIKSMLTFPIEDAVIDSFPIPLQKTNDPHKMIMVVATRISFLQTYLNAIQESGLDLTTIDIQELALRNITSLYENDEKTTALIYLQEKNSHLIITCQKLLYFQRQLEFGLSSATNIANLDVEKKSNPQLDKVALELQRSFDYYQTQWRQSPPARIFLAASELSVQSIANYFAQRLAMSVQVLDIRNVLISQAELSIESQGRYLPVIGGVLRKEGVQNAATN